MSKSINAAILTTSSQLSSISSALIRNIIFARLLSPEDFGIAMTFGVVLLFFEYATNLGHDNLILRSDKGNYRSFQATLHSTMLIRGLLLTCVLLIVSPYIGLYFKVPIETFDFCYLAIVPLINSFSHLDARRLQRHQDFSLSTKIVLTADIASIIIALTMAVLLNSYWAFYFSFIFRHSFGTVLSHVWAKRPYSLAWEKKYINQLLAFGLPLLAVGIMRFLNTEADKAIIARHSGLQVFTVYALTLMLVSNSSNLVRHSFSQIFIRKISSTKTVAAQTTAYESAGLLTLFLVLPILLVFGLMGEEILFLVFGSKHLAISYLFPAACSLILFRILNSWLTQITIAKDSTKILVTADIFKLFGLLLASLLSIKYSNVIIFCIAFTIGEAIQFVTLTFYLSKSRTGFILLTTKILIGCLFYLLLLFSLYEILHTKPSWVKALITLTGIIINTFVFIQYSKICKNISFRLIEYAYKLPEKIVNYKSRI